MFRLILFKFKTATKGRTSMLIQN